MPATASSSRSARLFLRPCLEQRRGVIGRTGTLLAFNLSIILSCSAAIAMGQSSDDRALEGAKPSAEFAEDTDRNRAGEIASPELANPELANPELANPELANPELANPELAIQRALEFLAAEVKSWPVENGCYSCHNTGDAARAVYRAMQLGHWPVAPLSSDSWLLSPNDWNLPEEGGPDGDQRLADLQFALAAKEFAAVPLAEIQPGVGAADHDGDGERERAANENRLRERRQVALTLGAERVRASLVDARHWPADPTSPLGSPVTYGPHLGTALVRQLLGPGESPETRRIWLRTRAWLLTQEPQSTLATAARILGLTEAERQQFSAEMDRSRLTLFDSQQRSGAWGPYPNSRPEIFDTAVAIIALGHFRAVDQESRRRVQRGREYLISQQWKDGSWTETTRPGGRESYAQRISTTAWAAIALLESVPLQPE